MRLASLIPRLARRSPDRLLGRVYKPRSAVIKADLGTVESGAIKWTGARPNKSERVGNGSSRGAGLVGQRAARPGGSGNRRVIGLLEPAGPES